jgi:hypothetical protein
MPLDKDTDEYVQATLMATLKPALCALCKARPADPVTWLANYLLAHKPSPPAYSITDAFKEACVEVFNLADMDGSGDLEFDEIRETIASHGAEAQAIMMTLDADRSGTISLDEWLSFFMMVFEQHRPMAEGLLMKCANTIYTREFMGMVMALYYEFDSDRSGQLELHEVMVLIGDDEQGKAFLEYADQDGDKMLSLDEWTSFFFMFWRVNPRQLAYNST